MEIVGLKNFVNDDVNQLIAKFVGTTPSKPHPTAEMMKKLIELMIEWHTEDILDGWWGWGYAQLYLGPLDDEEARQEAEDDKEDGAGAVTFASMAIDAIKSKIIDDEDLL